MHTVEAIAEAVVRDIAVIKYKIGGREHQQFRLQPRVAVANLESVRQDDEREGEGGYRVNERNNTIQKFAMLGVRVSRQWAICIFVQQTQLAVQNRRQQKRNQHVKEGPQNGAGDKGRQNC